jgi:hypothetical protein
MWMARSSIPGIQEVVVDDLHPLGIDYYIMKRRDELRTQCGETLRVRFTQLGIHLSARSDWRKTYADGAGQCSGRAGCSNQRSSIEGKI